MEDTVDIPSGEDQKTDSREPKAALSGDSNSRGFVDEFARRNAEPLHSSYASSPATFINRGSNSQELWAIVQELNASRKIEPHTYEELKEDPKQLEAYIADAATRQSRFREQAVNARIQARVYTKPDSPFVGLFEDEADLHDGVAMEAGRAAVEHYRDLSANKATEPSESLKEFLANHYAESSGSLRRQQEAQANVSEGKKPVPGAPPNMYQEQLLFTTVQVAQQKELAVSDFGRVHGYVPAVEALARRKAVLESEAWSRRKKALETAVNPGRRLWGKDKIVQGALAEANNARVEAFQAGDAAVAKFRTLSVPKPIK